MPPLPVSVSNPLGIIGRLSPNPICAHVFAPNDTDNVLFTGIVRVVLRKNVRTDRIRGEPTVLVSNGSDISFAIGIASFACMKSLKVRIRPGYHPKLRIRRVEATCTVPSVLRLRTEGTVQPVSFPQMKDSETWLGQCPSSLYAFPNAYEPYCCSDAYTLGFFLSLCQHFIIYSIN